MSSPAPDTPENAPPSFQPHPETVDLGRRCQELLAKKVERHLLAPRLGVSRKQVDHALRTMRKLEAIEAGEPVPPAPRRHRAVVRRPGPPPNWGWQEHAACKGKPLEWFFDPEGRESEGEKEARHRKAKTVCDRCPVSTECLDYAIDRPEKYGRWKLDQDERANERRRRMRIASGERGRSRNQEDAA